MNRAAPHWISCASPPALSDCDVHVWRVATSQFDPQWAESNTTAEERVRADRFVQQVAADQWLASRAALRCFAAAYLGIEPLAATFAHEPYGKPYIVDGRLQFNLSHTNGVTLLAFSLDTPVGVDVEQIRHDIDSFDIAPSVFSHDERELLAQSERASRLTTFFELWTIKEAWLKMLGTGLVDDLPMYSILTPDLLPHDLRPASLLSLDVGSEHAAALAVLREPSAIRWFEIGGLEGK